jgi:hypothetical protein
LIFESILSKNTLPGISPEGPAEFAAIDGKEDILYLKRNGFVDLMATNWNLKDALLSATYYLRSQNPAPVILAVGLTNAFLQNAGPDANDPFPGFAPSQPFYTNKFEHQIAGYHAVVLVGFIKTSELQQARLPLPELLITHKFRP